MLLSLRRLLKRSEWKIELWQHRLTKVSQWWRNSQKHEEGERNRQTANNDAVGCLWIMCSLEAVCVCMCRFSALCYTHGCQADLVAPLTLMWKPQPAGCLKCEHANELASAYLSVRLITTIAEKRYLATSYNHHRVYWQQHDEPWSSWLL